MKAASAPAPVSVKAGPSKKGVRPRTEGVTGELVEACPAEVFFGERKRMSPYDPLLLQLKAAGAGKFLKFVDRRARVSLTYRAKKLGIKVMFGEQGETLWVTLASATVESSGVVEKQPEKPTNSDLVLKAIEAKRHTAGEIVTWMRSNGALGIGITQVDGLITSLLRAGKIRLRPPLPGSSDLPERYILA